VEIKRERGLNEGREEIGEKGEGNGKRNGKR
jgi:hypothetical protein